MSRHLDAYLSSNSTHVLTVPKLGLEVRGQQTVATMCRKVIAADPTYTSCELHVYREDKLALTVSTIGGMATKSIRENDKGIFMGKYVPFDESKIT